MSVGVMTVGVMSVGEITVGVMTVGVMTVGVMRRPQKSKRRYKLNNTIRNRSIMIDDEKGYKKVMDEKYKIYCKKISDDLKIASRDNPKHFWKILGGHK
jgi:hypothetical protein